MPMPPSGRYEYRFSEPDAGLILQRAAELQRNANDARRMTVHELEEAAGSAGIEPVHVRRAASELALRRSRHDRSSPLLGAPRRILFEVILDGEIPVPAYEYVIEAVRRHTGELGSASLIGRSLTWIALPNHSRAGPGWSRTIALTIVPRAGRTRIRIEEKLDQLVTGVFGTVLAGVGGGGSLASLLPLIAFGVPAAIPLATGVWLGCCWAAARRVYVRRMQARERELHGALQAIVEIAEDYMGMRKLPR
ncbi:MAG: hypothetical protein KC457_16870 [Myxococcales bacterium]|nr:hypothetical protein [Myxococcales bacterium]